MRQLVVWQGIEIGEDRVAEFEQWLADEGFKCTYVEEYLTLPDADDPENTGGRNDVLFEVDGMDVPEFAEWRLQYGMRWWEDVVANQIRLENVIIPDDVLDRHPRYW